MAKIRTIDELRKVRAKRLRQERVIDLPLGQQEMPKEMKVKVILTVEDDDISIAMEKVRGSPNYNLLELWSCLFYAQMRVEQILDEE